MPIEERFYTVNEVSVLLHASRDVVRRLFRHRVGVMRLSHRLRPRMRIPESLLLAVMKELGYVKVDVDATPDLQVAGRDTARP